MTSTATYSFDPTSANIIINAFAKCGLQPTQLTAQHIANAAFEANLLNVDMSNRNPNGFAVETITQVLSGATASYSLAARIVSVAMAYLTSDSDDNCRVLGAISASQYASITDKTSTTSGGPTSYWFSNTKTPSITVWPLVSSDDTVTYTLNILAFRQNQDFNADSQYTTDLPYRFLDAFSTGLTARLADIYAPDRADRFHASYERKFALLASQDQEYVPITIMPDMSGYRA
jgi:hypothetical protein